MQPTEQIADPVAAPADLVGGPPRRRRRFLVALAIVLVLAGCAAMLGLRSLGGASSEHSSPFTGVTVVNGSATEADLTQLLNARAAAVMRHDEAAFMATVDPSDSDDVTSQRQLFHNLTALPLARYELSYFTPVMPRKP